MTLSVSRYRRIRFFAAALALLWCLPLVVSAACWGAADAPTARPVSVAFALRDAAAHHAAVCRCLNCRGGADGKRCCCTHARTAASGLVLRAACDSGTTLAASVSVFRVTVFSPALRLLFPPALALPLACFRPFASPAASLAPAPLGPPPRF